jgi:hypothetical protein
VHLVVGANALAAARCARALEVGARPKLIAPVPAPSVPVPSVQSVPVLVPPGGVAPSADTAARGTSTAGATAATNSATTTTAEATIANGGSDGSGGGGGGSGGGDKSSSSASSCSFLPPSLQQRISDGQVEWLRRGFADDDVRTLGRAAVGGVVDAVFVTLGRDEEALSMFLYIFFSSFFSSPFSLSLLPPLFFSYPVSFPVGGLLLFFSRQRKKLSSEE